MMNNLILAWNIKFVPSVLLHCIQLRTFLSETSQVMFYIPRLFFYLYDLLNIDNPYFEQMVGQIYPTELQLNKAKDL